MDSAPPPAARVRHIEGVPIPTDWPEPSVNGKVRTTATVATARELIKHKPARGGKLIEFNAGGISIIGHITKDELRRSLEVTETANGFANRFLWLGVRRSKCLPEGGAIHTVDFSDEVRRLGSAIESAKEASLIARDDDARERWGTRSTPS